MKRAGAIALVWVCACGGSSGDASNGDAAANDTSVADTGSSGDTAPSDVAIDAPACPAPVLLSSTIDTTKAPVFDVYEDPGSPEGIFDPAWTPQAMSYSSVTSQTSIDIRVATSIDAHRWSYVAQPTTVTAVSVPTTDATACGASTCPGNLIHEVSTIVRDIDDPDPKRAWKLFTHAYVAWQGATAVVQRYDWGYLAMYTAADPAGPWSAESKAIGWASSAPSVSQTGATFDASSIPALKDCVALTEPSAIVRAGGIDLAVGCVAVSPSTTIRIEQLRSTDHAATWTHVGTLLSADDATCVGSTLPQLNGADFFVWNGVEYLIASPTKNVTGGFTGYGSCLVFAVDHPENAGIRRNAAGGPIVVRAIKPQDDRFAGACAFTSLGYLMPALSLDAPPTIFKTYVTDLGTDPSNAP